MGTELETRKVSANEASGQMARQLPIVLIGWTLLAPITREQHTLGKKYQMHICSTLYTVYDPTNFGVEFWASVIKSIVERRKVFFFLP